MRTIDFQFSASPSSNDDQVRPVVDDIDVLKSLASDSLGIDPPEFFRQPALGIDGKLLIGRCSCGAIGCDDVRADVAAVDQAVTWQIRGHVYKFALDQYMDSINHAALNTSWESVGRAAERLVALEDFSRLEAAGYKFEWASTRIGRGRVTLSFANDGTQRLFDIGWNEQQVEDALRQVRRWVAEYI